MLRQSGNWLAVVDLMWPVFGIPPDGSRRNTKGVVDRGCKAFGGDRLVARVAALVVSAADHRAASHATTAIKPWRAFWSAQRKQEAGTKGDFHSVMFSIKTYRSKLTQTLYWPASSTLTWLFQVIGAMCSWTTAIP